MSDPPGEQSGAYGEGRREGSKNQKIEAGHLKGRVFKKEIEKHKERRCHKEGDGKVNDHGVGLALCHRESLEEISKEEGKMLQFLRNSLLQNPGLRITIKDILSMRSCRDGSGKVLASRMSLHVRTFCPERAF